MENLHLKNLKTDFETTLPTNQNYLNSVFKTKNLTYEQFTNCYLIHPYHNKEEKRRFLTGLYNLYKKEITNYEAITKNLVTYNNKKNREYYSQMDHQFFGSILTDLYIEDTLIKSLYNENEQKIFYNYLNELLNIYYKKYHQVLLNETLKMHQTDSLDTTLDTLKSFLTTEEIESIQKPKELNKTITHRNIKKINNHIFNTHPGIMLHYINFFDDIKKHTKKLIDLLVELNIIEIIN